MFFSLTQEGAGEVLASACGFVGAADKGEDRLTGALLLVQVEDDSDRQTGTTGRREQLGTEGSQGGRQRGPRERGDWQGCRRRRPRQRGGQGVPGGGKSSWRPGGPEEARLLCPKERKPV